MKIGILHAPKQYIIKCPPQGLMSIAAYLITNGVRCDILDANIHYIDLKMLKKNTIKQINNSKKYSDNLILQGSKFPEEELSEYFIEKKFDLIFVDCHFTGTANYSLKTIQLIKKVLPKCIVVTGGIHSTFFGRELMETHPIDIIIKGEGEEVAFEVVSSLENDLKLDEVRGIIFRNEGNIIETPGEGFIKDLNTLPPVYNVYEQFEIRKYRQYIQVLKGPFWEDQDPAGVILTSRGCIGRCTFCNSRLIDKGKYRSISAEEVYKRLNYLYDNYRPKKISIYDAMFGGNTKTFEVICDFFKKHKVKWGFETRIDVMTVDKLKLLKDTRCIYVLYGLESVDINTLKTNGKVPQNTTEDYYKKAVELFKETRKQGVWSIISILYGLPGDNRDIFDKTINFIQENDLRMNNLSQCIFYIPIAYPGTKLWDEIQWEQRCYDWDKYFINNENVIDEGKILYKNPNIDFDELKDFVSKSVAEIYSISKNMGFIEGIKVKLNHIKYLCSEGGNNCYRTAYNFKYFLLSIYYTITQPPTSL